MDLRNRGCSDYSKPTLWARWQSWDIDRRLRFASIWKVPKVPNFLFSPTTSIYREVWKIGTRCSRFILLLLKLSKDTRFPVHMIIAFMPNDPVSVVPPSPVVCSQLCEWIFRKSKVSTKDIIMSQISGMTDGFEKLNYNYRLPWRR